MGFGCWGFDGDRSIDLGRRPLYRLGRWRGRRRGAAHVPDPDQHVTVLVHSHALGFEELLLQIVEDLIVQLELAFKGAVGDSPTLAEEFHNLIEHHVEVHQRPSTCASAASTSGSQKVIAMARYRSMAVARAVRACSPRPSFRYRVPRPRWQWAWSGRMPRSEARAIAAL